MSKDVLKKFFEPSSLALIGATRTPGLILVAVSLGETILLRSFF